MEKMLGKKTIAAGSCGTLCLALLFCAGCSLVGEPAPASLTGEGQPNPVNGESPVPASPLCTRLALQIEFEQSQTTQVDQGPLESKMSAVGSIPLTVNTDASPMSFTGVGELPVVGGGNVGECSFQNSGEVSYRFEGEISPADSGLPELRLRGRRSLNVASDPDCGGITSTPFLDLDEKTLLMEEGQTVEWHWETPQGEGNSTWVLHLLCEE